MHTFQQISFFHTYFIHKLNIKLRNLTNVIHYIWIITYGSFPEMEKNSRNSADSFPVTLFRSGKIFSTHVCTFYSFHKINANNCTSSDKFPVTWFIPSVNSLKTKRICLPRSKHSRLRLYEHNALMLHKANGASCYEIRKKNTQTQCQRNVEELNFKPGGT
jgi:hypothetical protein